MMMMMMMMIIIKIIIIIIIIIIIQLLFTKTPSKQSSGLQQKQHNIQTNVKNKNKRDK